MDSDALEHAPANKPVAKTVAQLRVKAEKMIEDADEARLEAEPQIQRAENLQRKLASLNKAVDDAEDAIGVGDERNASFLVNIVEIESSLPASFSARNGYGEVVRFPLDHVGTLIALRAACEEWKRVRPILVAKATRAAADLKTLEKQI